MIPLKPVKDLVFRLDTLIDIKENPFLSIEQSNIAILPLLKKVGDRLPGKFTAAFWNWDSHTISLKQNTTIWCVKESDYIEKLMIEHSDHITEVTEISHEKLLTMPKKSAFMFHHSFYPKPKIDLEGATIPQETQKKLETLKQDYDNVISEHGSGIGLTHLEEMRLETDPELPLVTRTPYPLPLKYHSFVKEEIKNLFEGQFVE